MYITRENDRFNIISYNTVTQTVRPEVKAQNIQLQEQNFLRSVRTPFMRLDIH